MNTHEALPGCKGKVVAREGSPLRRRGGGILGGIGVPVLMWVVTAVLMWIAEDLGAKRAGD